MAYIGSRFEKSPLVSRDQMIAWYMTDAHDAAGALTDSSGNARTLSLTGTAPGWTPAALNGLPALAPSTGSAPLAWSTFPGNIKHGFIVAAYSGATFDPSIYPGLLTGPTTGDILVGHIGATRFFDNSPSVVPSVYKKKDVAFAVSAMAAPMSNNVAVIEFQFSGGISLDGIQLFQQRDFLPRRWSGLFFELVLAGKVYNEAERLGFYRYFAQKYQLFQETAAGKKIFPFPTEWTRKRDVDKSIASSRSVSGVVKQRVKVAGGKAQFTAGYDGRNTPELDAANAFHLEHYGEKSFIFRDFTFSPARDTESLFMSSFSESPGGYENRSYSFEVMQK